MSSHKAGVLIHKQELLEWRISASNYMEGETSTSRGEFHDREKAKHIKRLDGRLRVLEEEGEMLKGVLFESVQERRKLMTEIYQHFETIQHRLMQIEPETGEKYHHSGQIISFPKERRAGLLQVLFEESNPWLERRAIRANDLD